MFVATVSSVACGEGGCATAKSAKPANKACPLAERRSRFDVAAPVPGVRPPSPAAPNARWGFFCFRLCCVAERQRRFVSPVGLNASSSVIPKPISF
jgi:hypothetical protein